MWRKFSLYRPSSSAQRRRQTFIRDRANQKRLRDEANQKRREATQGRMGILRQNRGIILSSMWAN